MVRYWQGGRSMHARTGTAEFDHIQCVQSIHGYTFTYMIFVG